MKPRVIVVVAFLLVVAAAALYHFLRPQKVTLIVINGTVYTENEKQPAAEAIAIDKDRIVGVGSTKQIASSFIADRVIDLKGKFVYPGFIDSHAHLEGLGAALANLNLNGANSVGEIAVRVAEAVGRTPAGRWIRGRGWDQNRWASKAFPTHESLDTVVPEIPTYLVRVDGHAVWVNRKVLEIAGITRDTPDPPGGKIVRNRRGEPTGVFVDNAIERVYSVLPSPTEEERREVIEKAIQECLRNGLTEVHDMGVDLGGLRIYKGLISARRFPFRVYAAIDGTGETWEHYLKTGPEKDGYEGRLSVRALKLYADGALGSRGAALIEPYADDPNNRGLTVTSSDSLKKAVFESLDKGFQVCVHAIGDRANDIVLNVYESAFNSRHIGGLAVRFRVEHAQVVDPDDIPRFGALGVIPSMQPTHCTSDMYWAEARLGPKRILGAYAWRSFLNSRSIIPGGSDFPVESPNPIWGFYAAITRQDRTGWPTDGWHTEQKMTREEALKSYTSWGAYAAFQEDVKGSIVPGKWADLTILSKDIMNGEPGEILNTVVEMTVVAGEVVYQSGAMAREGTNSVRSQ